MHFLWFCTWWKNEVLLSPSFCHNSLDFYLHTISSNSRMHPSSTRACSHLSSFLLLLSYLALESLTRVSVSSHFSCACIPWPILVIFFLTALSFTIKLWAAVPVASVFPHVASTILQNCSFFNHEASSLDRPFLNAVLVSISNGVWSENDLGRPLILTHGYAFSHPPSTMTWLIIERMAVCWKFDEVYLQFSML